MICLDGRRILVTVIDDDEDDYIIICGLLREVGFNQYETKWVSNYVDAKQSILDQRADVYLIDYRLGERTGLDILDELKGLELSRPMILLTGVADRAVDITSMEKGASDFLDKIHLTPGVLERSIRYSMRRAEDLVQIKANERMKVQKDVAEATTAAKSRFLANMSHELRTPLTAVLGFTELAKNPDLSLVERVGFLETISKSGEHLLRVVNEILDLSKIEDGQFQIDSTPFLIRDSLKIIFEMMKPAAVTKGLELTLTLRDEIKPLYGADAHRFKQIMLNLLGNAIKFTMAGSINIIFENDPAELTYVISISDTGLGLRESEKERLFRPYSQANSQTSKRFGGTGLGLDLSRKLARALGGDLSLVQSEINVGSTFALKLPLSDAPLGAVTQHQELLTKAAFIPFQNMRVLVADDSADNQILISHFLKNIGLVLTFALNGREALARAGEFVFDAVLMDIEMPEMGGYEATELLRKSGFKGPIIALTAHAFSDDRENVMKFGFTDFVSKPIDRKLLIAALKNAECPSLQ